MNPRRLSHFASKSVEGSDLLGCGGKSQKVTRGPHRNDVSPLTQGLRYRAACDIVVFKKCSEARNNNHHPSYWLQMHNELSLSTTRTKSPQMSGTSWVRCHTSQTAVQAWITCCDGRWRLRRYNTKETEGEHETSIGCQHWTRACIITQSVYYSGLPWIGYPWINPWIFLSHLN